MTDEWKTSFKVLMKSNSWAGLSRLEKNWTAYPALFSKLLFSFKELYWHYEQHKKGPEKSLQLKISYCTSGLY